MKDIHGDYGPGTAHAKKMLCNGGYKTGGDITLGKVKKVVKKAVHEHETHEHEGKHTKLKLKSGGGVKGEHAKERPDRRARGGAAPKSKVGSVNIMIGKDGDGQDQQMQQQQAAKAGLQKGIQLGAQLAARKMAGGAPGGGAPIPPPGAGAPPPPPMAGPGGPPMPMRKKGGYIADLDAGAGGARGRMEKAGLIQVKAHQRRRGGQC